MRTLCRTSAVLTVVLCGCGAESATAPTPTIQARPTGLRAAVSVPIGGSCETSLAGPPIVTPPILTQNDVGVCQLAHLGRVSVYDTQQINLATGTETAQVTFTAANGDELRLTNVGANERTGPATIRFTGTITVVGGTGRFANATGQITAEGTADLVSGQGWITLDGSIAYDASNRSGN